MSRFPPTSSNPEILWSFRIASHPIPRYNHSMPHTYEEVRQIASELPEAQRILLANSLWESVGSDSGNAAEIEAEWDGEIKRRLDEIDSGAVQMVPLEDVFARMDARILSRRRR